MFYDEKYFLKKLITKSIGRFFKTKGQRTLMYHSINGSVPDDRYNIYSINENLFLEHMGFLKHFFKNNIKPINKLSFENKSISITFDDGFKNIYEKAYPVLEKFKLPFTVFVSPKFIEDGDNIYLNKIELNKLSRSNLCTIGAHGYSHKPLTTLNKISLRNELERSKFWLEDCIGKEINCMSYPHGAVNQLVKKTVTESGFQYALSSKPGSNSLLTDKFELKRTTILSHDNINQFESKLRGDWDWTRLIKLELNQI